MKKQSKKPSKWSVESAAKRMIQELEECYWTGPRLHRCKCQKVAEQIIRETIEECAKVVKTLEGRYCFQVRDDSAEGAHESADAIRAMLGRWERKTHDLKKA